MAPEPRPRILLIDAYDSFTYNLSDQLARCTSAEIHTIHIDAPFTSIAELLPHLPSFDAVIIGPGPGTPSNPDDIGIVKDIWHLSNEHLIPIFGVCLGLQSLCLEFGGAVDRLNTVKHGLTARIEHDGRGLFVDVGETVAVRYHSLHATIPKDSRVLEPLAWVTDEENGRVLMGVRHTKKPFWAVQYHPESICTEGGDRVIENFWKMAQEWNRQHGRMAKELLASWTIRPREPSLLEQLEADGDQLEKLNTEVYTVTFQGRGIDVGRICERLGAETADEFVLLDSAAHPGKWAIIGIVSPHITRRFRYHVGDSFLTYSTFGEPEDDELVNLEAPYNRSVWKYLARFMDVRYTTSGDPDSPFWGGLVGYFSYELGVDSLSIPLHPRNHKHPDVNLVFIERSIVINTLTGQTYIQSLLSNDHGWLHNTKVLLQQERDLSLTPATTPPPDSTSPATASRTTAPQKLTNPVISGPTESHYTALVRAAQSHLSLGDSYELCLTARTKIQLSTPPPSPWSLYTSLRARNPAPYAAFLRLQGTTLLSSSPERFLSFSRTGQIQLRPIKGTVRKTPTTTLTTATTLLNTPKERAENLMILDLIRHDLHRILGSGNVAVEKLMGVEEYKTVYQLVSVITGTIPEQQRGRLTGLDVLATSLPPGSMTGAPKKRSVEILRDLEVGDEERGVYSGVMGYMSVCGAGDWCVVIRSAVKLESTLRAFCG
ncbi:para-aminobenzoate synthase [Ascodesmis nigricans]|uniref:aminodeoxychorismate synthase n=1 Tax=Ascodesmis nigricans TaxID=341454 RepID=A0A4S2N1U4_9PEZI|nr:para-aminobenzoate synthase [Ascodesmis nigricans]